MVLSPLKFYTKQGDKFIRKFNRKCRYDLCFNSEERDILMLVLYAVALGMGIVSVVLVIIGEGSTETILTLLAIGMFCLGFAGINSLEGRS